MAGEAKRRALANSPEAISERWRKAVGGGLLVGQPIFGGLPCSENATALATLGTQLAMADAPWGLLKITNESLIPRARNAIASHFLTSKEPFAYEWLVQIDSDIIFRPEDVLLLLESGHKVVGGAYPRKQIEWDTVVNAARAGVQRPERFASSYVVNLLPDDVAEGAATFDERGCVEVLDLPTGFLLTHRSVFEQMRDASHPAWLGQLQYETDDQDKRPCWNFFPTPVLHEGGRWRYLSEDYGFCRLWQSVGGRCHLHTEIELHHIGRHVFMGNRELILEGACK